MLIFLTFNPLITLNEYTTIRQVLDDKLIDDHTFDIVIAGGRRELEYAHQLKDAGLLDSVKTFSPEE